MKSTTSRTLNYFKELGCPAKVVEKWVGFGKVAPGERPGVRRDLWGADILVRQGGLLLAIQSTSGTNHSNHVMKCLLNDEIKNWIECGVAFYIYSWSKRGPRGKRKVWTPRITQLVIGTEAQIIVL
jgi:hypothetical protein